MSTSAPWLNKGVRLPAVGLGVDRIDLRDSDGTGTRLSDPASLYFMERALSWQWAPR